MNWHIFFKFLVTKIFLPPQILKMCDPIQWHIPVITITRNYPPHPLPPPGSIVGLPTVIQILNIAILQYIALLK